MQFWKFLQRERYAGYVLLMMIMVYFTNQFDRFIFSSAKIPFINYSSYEYGMLVGPIFTLMYTVAGIAVGLIGERHRVKVICVCAMLWSTLIGCIAFTTEFWQVALLVAGLGIGEAGCTPFASSLLSDFFPEELQGTAMACYNLAVYLGYGLALAAGAAAGSGGGGGSGGSGGPGLLLGGGWRAAYLGAGAAGIGDEASPLLLWNTPQKSAAPLGGLWGGRGGRPRGRRGGAAGVGGSPPCGAWWWTGRVP